MVGGALALAAFFAQTAPGPRGPALVEGGIELLHAGRFHEAAEKLVQALALDPKLSEAHYLLGLIRQNDGRADAAMQSFQTALKIQPRYAEAQARVCELEVANARARETGYDKAAASCRRAIQLAPRDPEPHYLLGWTHAQLGDLPAAIASYETALKLDPKFPRVRFELAMAYAGTQTLARAIPLLRQVVTAEPANTNAHYHLGSALAKQDDCAAALPHLQAATQSAQKHYLLATCLKKLNREEEAAAELAKVKDARQGAEARMQARYRAAVAHQKAQAGQFEEAIAEYRAALALVPGDRTLAVDLAVALLRKGDAEEVIRLLGSDASPLGRYQVALAYSKLNRRDEARRALELILRDKPTFAEAWYQLGVVSLALGQAREAEASFAAAVRLRPDETALRLAWAESLEKLGKGEQAATQRKLAAGIPR
jgi:tetratricopeptide (TPR) repeat protein